MNIKKIIYNFMFLNFIIINGCLLDNNTQRNWESFNFRDLVLSSAESSVQLIFKHNFSNFNQTIIYKNIQKNLTKTLILNKFTTTFHRLSMRKLAQRLRESYIIENIIRYPIVSNLSENILINSFESKEHLEFNTKYPNKSVQIHSVHNSIKQILNLDWLYTMYYILNF